MKTVMDRLVDDISSCVDHRQLDAALIKIINLVWSLLTDPNLVGKLYSSAVLDRLTLDVGNAAFEIYFGEQSLGKVPVAGSTAYIATNIYSLGGHSRVIEDLIKAQPAKRHTVILTNILNHQEHGREAEQRYRQLGADVVYIPDGTLISKLLWLQGWLIGQSPETVFLLNHHHDAVAIGASLPCFPGRYVYYHHADHALALGVTVEHFIHADPHNIGYFNCRDALGIDNVHLPLSVEDQGDIRLSRGFMKQGRLRTCSSGTFNKFCHPYEFSYFAMIPEILTATGGVHIHIGPLPEETLQSIYKELDKAGIQKERFVYIAQVRSLWTALLEHDVDLYIASFPLGGGRASIEVMGAGIPIVFHRSPQTRNLDGSELAYREAFIWRRPAELLAYLKNLDGRQLLADARQSRAHYEQFYDLRLLQKALQDLPERIAELNVSPLPEDQPKEVVFLPCDRKYAEDKAAQTFSIVEPDERLEAALNRLKGEDLEPMGANLIFVGGSPRSGTTLVQNILDSHPEICGGPEFDHIANIVNLRDNLIASSQSGRIDAFVSRADIDREIGTLIERLLTSYGKRKHKRLISEKTPWNVYVFRQLMEIFPRARFIFCIRDPRAVVASMLEVGRRAQEKGKPYPDFAVNVDTAISVVKACNEAGLAVLPHERVHLVRYEDLVTNPEMTTRRLCGFLQLPWSETMLSPEQRQHDGERTLDGVWYDSNSYYRPISTDGLESWQTSLNSEQIHKINEAFREDNGLAQLGYTFGRERYVLWQERHPFRAMDAQLFAERMAAEGRINPVIHLIVSLEPDQQSLLADTIDALSAQIYPHWRFTVVARHPAPDPIFEELEPLQWLEIDGNTSLADGINQAALQTPADWVAVVEAGDRFAPHLLATCADYINLRPDWRFIYTDEDSIGADGVRSNPQFKPDFNLDLLRSMPYMGSFCLVRRDVLEEIGGYTVLAGVANYDLAFKVLDYCGEQAIGHIADILYHRLEANRDRYDAQILEENGRQVVLQHLARRQIDATVHPGLLPGSFFIDYPLTAGPLVSIIIPTRDRLDLIKPCVDSLLEKTRYSNYEVLIMDNGSQDVDTLSYLNSLPARDSRVRVLPYPHEYNFSAINNAAAREARGEYLLLLNNDTIIVQPNWLERMLAQGLRPEVGIVGARLVFPDQTLQHAGVIIGMAGTADHPHISLPMNEPGYLGRAQVVQNFSAVTAACLLIKKDLYVQVEGLDEIRFKVLFNDVDLCLKVGELGHKIVWTPYATLVHHGSSSLKTEQDPRKIERDRKAALNMVEKWLPRLAHDPAYNRHLSLIYRDFRIETDVDANWDPNFHDRPRILAAPLNSFATGEYRVRAPLRALENADLARCALLPNHDAKIPRMPEPAEIARLQPDVLLLQNAVYDEHIHALDIYKRFNKGVLRVFGQDDLLFELPHKNPFRQTTAKDIKKRLRQALSLCDRLIVATEPMADALREMIDDIRVVSNYLERARWGRLTSQRHQGERPRVGWAGGEQHQGDLELILPVLKATAKEVDWVFFGMCPDALRPYVKEFHHGVVLDEYPAKLASLNLDLAVAPLEHNRFNAAKSNLRLLEFGILGWPVVCTDILPYQNAPVKRVPNNPAAWIKAVRERIYDLDATHAEGDQLRQWVFDNWMLEDHLEEWLRALLVD